MKKMIHQDIDETRIEWQHTSGLHIVVMPKKNYHKTYVTLSTPFGANHTLLKAKSKTIDIPHGTAHFLEHKLFDRDGVELSKAFANQNASVNAYTQNNQTTFLFSCSNHLSDHLRRLIDMVFNPVFTEEGIQKEISIIDEEIEMYQDNAYTLMYEGILNQMYHNHPIKNAILGTKESIRNITKPLLETIHQAAYNPKNMILFIIGKVNPKTIYDVFETIHIPQPHQSYQLADINVNEPTEVVDSSLKVHHQDVLIPHNCLGIKLDIPTPITSLLKEELIYSILFEMVLGKSSETYQSLIQKRVINDSFDLDITIDHDIANILLSCNLDNPLLFFDTLKEVFNHFDSLALDDEVFIRVKNQILGGFIHALNSLEYVANQYTKYYFLKDNLFHILDVMKTITLDDIKKAQDIIQAGRHAFISIQKKVH